jgi:outer membrane lipoprotein-sorting protein
MIQYIVLILLLAAVPASAFFSSQEEALNSLRSKYGKMNGVMAEFMSVEPVSGMRGMIRATVKGQYIIDVADRHLVCDGKNIWNYSPSQRSVTISPVRPGARIGLDQILFTFLKSYKAERLVEYQASKGQRWDALELKPADANAASMGIQKLIVYLEKGGTIIRRIATMGQAGNQVWDIIALKTDPKFKSGQFTYKPPKDVQIIDLR